MSSSSLPYIFGAYLPFLLITLFYSLFYFYLVYSCPVFTSRTISLCFSWFSLSYFYFSYKISFFLSSSFFRSFLYLSRALIFQFPSFSIQVLCSSSCLTSSSSWEMACSLIYSVLGFFSLSLFSIYFTFSSLMMQASCSFLICFYFQLMASTCFLVFCVNCFNYSSILLILLAVSRSSLFFNAFSWVFLIFYKDYFYYQRAFSCPLRCLSSFYFSTILLMSYLLSRFLLSLVISALFF